MLYCALISFVSNRACSFIRSSYARTLFHPSQPRIRSFNHSFFPIYLSITQVKLAELSEGAILHNLRMRYVANDIYVRLTTNCGCVFLLVLFIPFANVLSKTLVTLCPHFTHNHASLFVFFVSFLFRVFAPPDVHFFDSAVHQSVQVAANLLGRPHQDLEVFMCPFVFV